jgi:hypothetical protein
MSKGRGVPFLIRFGRLLNRPTPIQSKYDESRQLNFVLSNGAWVPAIDADRGEESQTTVTEVKRETTDE